MKMLPPFYQTYLKSQLSLAEYLFLQILINLLQVSKQVKLETLATVLPIPITFESRRKRIQRFLSLPSLTIEKIWLPLVATRLSIYWQAEKMIYLVIDRTAWGRGNLFVVSVVWDKRAFPVYFELLPKLGSSNLGEQQAVLKRVFPVFKGYKVCVLGDREFCSVALANWLREEDASFCLRLKKSHQVELKPKLWSQLDNLGLSPGVSFFLAGIRVTKAKGFNSFNVASKWQRKIKGVAPKEGWFTLTNLATLSAAITADKSRFDIEEMFRDFKGGGYNLEDTSVAGKRLISLIILTAIAYTSARIQGQEIKRKGVQKYVGRLQEPGRLDRRHSSFYIGLYGQNWVNFVEPCRQLVTH